MHTACSVTGCDKPVQARGWCQTHYMRWRRTGSVEDRPCICSIDGCDRSLKGGGRGWCKLHYGRWQRHGDPLTIVRPHIGDAASRFWSKVDRDGPVPEHRPDLGPCWVWIATARTNGGYGAFSIGPKMIRAHRYAYELLVGPIPDDLTLDHLCRNRTCVNPVHLEPVTLAENISRGDSGQHYGSRTHCKWGHPFNDANTIHRANGGRACRECLKRRMREYRARLKEKAG